jgi:anti-sigma regulatory factor (Ser/Thr protein kinase)
MARYVPGSCATLAIAATAAEVRRASHWLQQTGAEQGVPAQQIERLELCLNEVLANVISHAGVQAHSQPVELRLQRVHHAEGFGATVTVSDAGMAFDSSHVGDQARATRLEDATPGGLGLAMIANYSDALQYQRIGERNELSFGVHWV